MGFGGRFWKYHERGTFIHRPQRTRRKFHDLNLKDRPQLNISIWYQPTAFLRLHTDDHADPSCRIKIQHGTTTLAFRFKGGVIVAVDSRATAGSYIGKYNYQSPIAPVLIRQLSIRYGEKGH